MELLITAGSGHQILDIPAVILTLPDDSCDIRHHDFLHYIRRGRKRRKQAVGHPGFIRPGNQFRLFIINSQIVDFQIMQRGHLDVTDIHLHPQRIRDSSTHLLSRHLHESAGLYIIFDAPQSQQDHRQDRGQYS